MTIAETRKKIKQTLSGYYDDNEIRNFTDLLFFHLLNYSKIDIRMKGNEVISQQDEKTLHEMLIRLKAFEPVQYILGRTVFFDLPFLVSPHVLIPRPETEELVAWVCKDYAGEKVRILDIGTGSGCIAVALAKNLPLAEISGCDNNEKAIEISVKNAGLNGARVSFFVFDMLNPATTLDHKYHVLVSNPPYIRQSEKTLMHANVLNYEPHRALFVPDDNPMLFYKAIAELGHEILLPEGAVYCEMNENLPAEILRVFSSRNYKSAEMRTDINGKSRMIKAIKNG
jgi:release factor glutamine methyltransferase